MPPRIEEQPANEKGLPAKPGGLLGDIRAFILHKPAIPTLIEYADEVERDRYSHSIFQRIGISVTDYSVLNIHRIGIDAPVRFVFEELLKWDGAVSYWPNHIATAYRVDGRLEHIQIYLLGRRKSIFGIEDGFMGMKFIPLFELTKWNFKPVPAPTEPDNARYLLYRCSGGYPIGFYCLYARSPISDRGEVGQTQLFSLTSFDFYGKKNWPHRRVVNPIWETIHNRVTANVMNRIKLLCEGKFQMVVDGEHSRLNMSRSALDQEKIREALETDAP
jgi:hypothetical protein